MVASLLKFCFLLLLAAQCVAPQAPKPNSPIVMDFAKQSLDDQYKGCRDKMLQKVQKVYLKKELKDSKNFRKAWSMAKMEMKNKPLKGLTPEQATAVYAYSTKYIYTDFNAAVRNGGGNNYKAFPFKALHFYLTEALKKLRTKFKNCYNVYRGVSMPTKVSLGQIVRFGQFTSTSRNLNVAEGYGTATVFVMKTCRGAPIDDYSWFIKNEEVLVPPFERFQVVAIFGNKINLTPLPETKSIYNCLAVHKGKKHG
ncbi:NAD(P)(+)--arginine ADP-ribosyltransferase 2-like isoform X2 [Polyodon spathula]|uniref:NAD(P)(+)--arginine ADP-ribosyltransferase 2-like isoform X1 n=1 Tax=Polyodon spathula TaxID=7913 RepID=UPI001B7DB81D|nr:NAD(P)(+)--arginine ADP-ribosyltransferase 2-like isoform X1 [Polyodon spathula]XP_041099454.1 NAD(P)(+)--arginine ADP-ribosyltransferase 2-like isoform X2 [Polyodon spathula]XP_041112297.1 NAD(P)(+)--arginine ADP-ribosyltransferase 2-like isoform X1 [Polyodon spathula]XP_041112298.1 NAD(P)(+)--arginine ADP-ribosyltransferase 2-like isoform X2 [Polyodon spathula]